MARYTVDEWETVNDVLAWYDGNREGWDRFKFSISLGAQALQERVVWLVGKYAGGAAAEGGGECGEPVEWWDNNQGKNYRVGFKAVEVQEARAEVYKRSVVVSAPSMSFCSFFLVKTSYALTDNFSDLHQSHTHIHAYQIKTIRSSNILIHIFRRTSISISTRTGESPTSSSHYAKHSCEVEEVEFKELCCS